MEEHLSNNPDDREGAELEWKLARMPRHSASATSEDSIELPPKLASRTCAKIWATIDNKEQDFMLNSGTFLDSAYFSPETVLPDSYLLGTSEPEEIRRETPKVRKRVEIVEEPPRPATPGNGLIVSIVIGVVISVFLFPMIAYVTRSTKSYVANSWESEINRRVGNYEQIHASQGNAAQSEEQLPYNLATSSWQELQAEMFAHAPRPNPVARPFSGAGSQPPTPFEAVVGEAYAQSHSNEAVVSSTQYPDGTVSPQSIPSPILLKDLANFPDWGVLVSADVVGMADTMLLATPSREITVRSAFGQNILLKDGRVFFRVLPGIPAAEM